MFKFTIIAAILFITTATNTIAAIISWHRRNDKRGLYFAVGITAVTFWTLVSALDYAAIPLSLKVFFAKWEYVGYHIALVFFLMFVVSYAGYGELLEKKAIRAALFILPASNILLAFTNEWHGWLWAGFIKSEFGDNTYIFEHGPAFLWVAGIGYALLVGILIAAGLAWRRRSELSRRQSRLIFFASLLPLIGNLVYLFQPPQFDGVDWSSILFSASSLLVVWALYGTRLLDIVPVAREKLIDSLSDGMIVLDMQGRIVDVNRPAALMIGTPAEKLLGRDMAGLIPLSPPLSENPPAQEVRAELEMGGAEKRHFDVLVSPLLEDQTRVVGRLIIFRDVTERKLAQDELLSLAQTDALTGLFNRGHFFQMAAMEFEKSVRHEHPLSVILLDIDQFKQINDTYGHPIGDQVLTQIGGLLHAQGRATDLLARYGGEEFVILLTETDCAGAWNVAERLRMLIQDFSMHIDNQTIRVTASFGIAGRELDVTMKFDQLIQQADQALYEAKRMGKNRVVCRSQTNASPG